MKALDIVKTPKGGIAIITETNKGGKDASIDYIKGCESGERNAWWDECELTVIDSIPRLLAAGMAHPFGDGKKDVVELFPVGV